MKKSLGRKTLLYPCPAWVIGSYDENDKANIMAVAWGGICCSKPPMVTISLRKATHTYGSIVARKAYTVNILSASQVAETDYVGIASGRDRKKFADCGLTAVKSDLIDAPYIDEAPLVIECRLVKTVELGLHTQFIGEIVDVKADESILADGKPDLSKLDPIVYATGTSQYYRLGEVIGDGYTVGKKFGE
jgi:flavin reductase (DIM6/NTAB) family NADH-FMN oxidoreductase RutF